MNKTPPEQSPLTHSVAWFEVKFEFLMMILLSNSEKIAPLMFAVLFSNEHMSSVMLLLHTINAPPTVVVVQYKECNISGWGLTFLRSRPAVFDTKEVAIILTVLLVLIKDVPPSLIFVPERSSTSWSIDLQNQNCNSCRYIPQMSNH